MKKTLICTLLAISTASFASEIKDASKSIVSGSTVTTTIKAPKVMNSLSINKEIDEDTIQMVDQPKQAKELVGSNSATWRPDYLKVESYKNCLDVQEYRGWEGWCMPAGQPKNCPDNSWSKLQEINLVPCAKDRR